MTTILTIDDSPVDQRLAGAFLESQGCTPIYASNGSQAVEILRHGQPDAVLTDLQMPEMNGLELVKHVRRHFPNLPVILMTAFGSEEIALQALLAGASSYVRKQHLRRDLGEALRVVLAAVETVQQRDQVRHLLVDSKARFVLGYERGSPQALVHHLCSALEGINFCDQTGLLQIATALTEALTNAIDHGNLELDSDLRDSPGNQYRELGNERAKTPPYCDRKVYVTIHLSAAEVRYTIRDEGAGFDHTTLLDPTDPENLLKASGRGIMLIRTFMDETWYNSEGNELTMVKRR
ncbi:MAG: response regulator [Gemmataceae bacterium]